MTLDLHPDPVPQKVSLLAIPGFLDNPETTLMLLPERKPKFGYREFPSPLVHKASWRKAYEQAQKSYRRIIAELSIYMDKYHGVTLGKRYWEQIIGWFLMVLIDAVVEWYVVLDSVRVKYPRVLVIGIDPADFGRPADALYFTEAIRKSDLANLQVFTQVAINMKFPMDLRPLIAGELFIKPNETRIPEKKIQFNDPPASLELGLPFADIWMYKTVMRRRTLALLSAFNVFRIADIKDFVELEEDGPLDLEGRDKLDKLGVESDYDRVILAVLSQILPRCYLEQWETLAKRARSWIAKKRPRVIVTGVGGLCSPQYSVWAAECQRLDTKIIGLQHGGCYGERDYASSENHERRIADKYITWGWQEDEKTVALPAARLACVPKYKMSECGSILWIGTSDSRYIYQMGPRPVGKMFEEYFCEQITFAKTLDNDVLRNMIFRPYPTEFNWPEQLVVSSEIPVEIDDMSKSYWDRIRESSLIIVDHIGSTTLLEALVIGRPVVCFGGADVYDIRDSAKPFYDALGEVAVFHNCPKSAASTVNYVVKDILGWWLEPKRQRAVKAFCENFAQNKSFFRKWRRFLSEIRKTDKTAN